LEEMLSLDFPNNRIKEGMPQDEKEKEMLNIFADALLIVTRMEPRQTERPLRRAEPESVEKAQARWYALTGLRR
jgi:hypothetical protein